MKTTTYDCEVLTPMFLYGSKPEAPELPAPELRPPSFKGGLRFWWRALQNETSMETLKEKEGKIFGDTQQKSKVLIRVLDDEMKIGRPPLNSNLNYIAFGVEEQQCYLPGSKFRVKIACPTTLVKEVEQAFKMMVLFGGIGGKSRNGFGSIHVEQFRLDYSELSSLINKANEKLKPYTAFSKKIWCGETRSFKNWKAALNKIAITYKSVKKGQEIKRDNFYLGYSGEIKGLERHAKSCFFNVIKENGEYYGVVLFLPYKFLENFQGDKDAKTKFDIGSQARHAKKYLETHHRVKKIIKRQGLVITD